MMFGGFGAVSVENADAADKTTKMMASVLIASLLKTISPGETRRDLSGCSARPCPGFRGYNAGSTRRSRETILRAAPAWACPAHRDPGCPPDQLDSAQPD